MHAEERPFLFWRTSNRRGYAAVLSVVCMVSAFRNTGLCLVFRASRRSFCQAIMGFGSDAGTLFGMFVSHERTFGRFFGI